MTPEQPWLCLVTDRRRLAAAAGRPEQEWRTLLLAQIEGAVQAAVNLVQIRERDLPALSLLEVVRAAVALAAGSSTRIVVNDRIDVALAAGAAGVHLRGDSPPSARTVTLAGPHFLVGRSVHGPADVLSDSGAQYFLAGTVFPTLSKADKGSWLGPTGLSSIVRAAGRVPVLAIGGMTETTVAGVTKTGVVGIASIGAFLPEVSGEQVASAVVRRADTLRRVFMTAAADL